MKKVLVVTYSQSGQLNEITDNIIKGLNGKVEIVKENLQPDPPTRFRG